MVTLLLRNGADPDSLSKNRKTPQDVIPPESKNKDAIVRLFNQPREKWHPKQAMKIPKFPDSISPDIERVCKKFFVHVRFYWPGRKTPYVESISWSKTVTVYNVLFDKDKLALLEEEFLKIVTERAGGMKLKVSDNENIWKWFHFPANNVSTQPACPQIINNVDYLTGWSR
jgi:hypothetical protein